MGTTTGSTPNLFFKGEGALRALVERAGGSAVRLDVDCCGAAGSYAFKAEHEAVAFRLGGRVREQVAGQTGTLLVDSGTCALHLSQMSGIESQHPAMWLFGRTPHADAGATTF